MSEPSVSESCSPPLPWTAPVPPGSRRLHWPIPVASVDGLFFTQDRVAVTQGHMADPSRPYQIMMNTLAAHQLGYHLGESIPYGIYSQQQEELPGFGTSAVRPTIERSGPSSSVLPH